ncbi:MAG: hypothetical protein IJB72_02895 [Clostridia bacterium]|nr:hypothetical protein [Clostridia bacterium]
MTDYTKVYYGISKSIWGYFFLYLNFTINIGNGSISLLPSFVGYILFLKAIDLLKDEERELSLLKTLGVILGVWEGIQWLANCVGYSFDGKWQFINLIIGLVNLYFHFQFLTNLASIATKHQQENCIYDKDLLTCRTVQTIIQTLFLTISNLNIDFTYSAEEIMFYVTMIFMVVYFIFLLGIGRTLVQLRKHLKYYEEITEENSITE